jgi:hypothetical protein
MNCYGTTSSISHNAEYTCAFFVYDLLDCLHIFAKAIPILDAVVFNRFNSFAFARPHADLISSGVWRLELRVSPHTLMSSSCADQELQLLLYTGLSRAHN